MKRLGWLILLAAFGCQANRNAVQMQKEPGSAVTSTVKAAPKFAMKDLAGQWKANAAFDPSVPMDKRQMYLKAMESFNLVLRPNGTFTLSTKTGQATGKCQIAGQALFVTMLAQNGKPVSQAIEDAEKKGVSKEQAEQIAQPAKFDISDDGSQLTSRTGNPDVLIILKRSKS